MHLRTWLLEELTDVNERIAHQVLELVPVERWSDQVDGGGSSITGLLWHVARHRDVALTTILPGRPQLLDTEAERVGAAGLPAGSGLSEAEARAVTDRLRPAAVGSYFGSVASAAVEWVRSADVDRLDDVPDAAATLGACGVDQTEFPWLYRMWSAKPAAFFVRWEIIGHAVTHLGEMVSIRNRMGLSPF